MRRDPNNPQPVQVDGVNILPPGARTFAPPGGGAPAAPAAQSYYLTPSPQVYAALVPPQYALNPTTGSGLFGQG